MYRSSSIVEDISVDSFLSTIILVIVIIDDEGKIGHNTVIIVVKSDNITMIFEKSLIEEMF